jgi:hypothetical protein
MDIFLPHLSLLNTFKTAFVLLCQIAHLGIRHTQLSSVSASAAALRPELD